ncbi:MAG: hypothetical protein P4L54_00005, partial [Acidocella sp.]|nr:hypothetical protein [Acidocella sp.]
MNEIERLSQILKIKFDRLESLLKEESIDDTLELSAILRHFLMDQSLIDNLSNEIGLSVNFPLDENEGATQFGKIADFLKRKFGDFSVFEIVDSISNYGGGVHHYAKDSRQVEVFDKLVGNFDNNFGYDALRYIAESVLQSLTPLRTAIDRLVNFVEQRKRSRQPLIVGNMISFEGSHYLECWKSLNFERGFSIVMPFSMPPTYDGEQCIFAVGNRKAKTEVSLWRTDYKTLQVKLIFEGKLLGKVMITKSHFKLSDVICITVDPSKDALQRKLRVAFHDGYEKTCSIKDAQGHTEGRLVIGADLHGKHCAHFQAGDLTLI